MEFTDKDKVPQMPKNPTSEPEPTTTGQNPDIR
jgi:hypothetical protein